MDYAIRSEGLTRRFGRFTAVDGLDLRVREAAITGFLGPNGAGKTTTISLLLGLLKAQEGTCEVLGMPPGAPAALAQIGAMVESPSLYDHLTGLENVEITRLMRGVPRTETDRVLNLVGLAKDARRPVRTYSLGMRQRLGMALALMGQPRLLILDEPTNGLDPSGIHEMRELVRSLPAETGATVFLSSHILAEVEQIASDVVVIHHGRLKYQGPLEDMGTPGPSTVMARVDESGRAKRALEALGFRVREDGDRLSIEADASAAPRIAEGLVREGIPLFELVPHKINLESRFLALLEEP
ncbi:MAG TPA: ATP-binding cassette domain-containing protein [Holophagaceae bacterium]|nr:ATP-binding cassette domain-containing protein [Holophagaceae bacterium]